MPSSRRRWTWLCWVVCLLLVGGVLAYLVSVGLERADKISSSIAALAALAAFFAPYLLPRAEPAMPAGVHALGAAAAAIGGDNTGEITTNASDEPTAGPPPPGEVSATGPASVAIGGKNDGDIRTNYRGRGRQA
ncbi:hypothetical protein [Micromonospora sp. DT31]|uniref:hypothetical protein n=1 Tax=Micromonospora sp. DT31 TaxID=3393434 RepID=UPI003CF892E7